MKDKLLKQTCLISIMVIMFSVVILGQEVPEYKIKNIERKSSYTKLDDYDQLIIYKTSVILPQIVSKDKMYFKFFNDNIKNIIGDEYLKDNNNDISANWNTSYEINLQTQKLISITIHTQARTPIKPEVLFLEGVRGLTFDLEKKKKLEINDILNIDKIDKSEEFGRLKFKLVKNRNSVKTDSLVDYVSVREYLNNKNNEPIEFAIENQSLILYCLFDDNSKLNYSVLRININEHKEWFNEGFLKEVK